MYQSGTSSGQRRPQAVSFAASLLLCEAVLVMLSGIMMGSSQVASMPLPDLGPDDAFGPIVYALPTLWLAMVIVVAGAGLLLAGFALLRMRESGWVLAMALQGIGLANALYAHFHGERQYVQLALCSFVVLALNQREVRQAFQAQPEHD